MSTLQHGRALPILLGILTLWGMLPGCVSAQQPRNRSDRDYELFVCALEEMSTAPLYVLITVIDGRSGKEMQEATTANLLMGAIHGEYDIPTTDEGIRQVDQILRSAHDRRFTFHRAAALANIPPQYTPALLADVRDRLSSTTDEELIRAVSYDKLGPRGEILTDPLMESIYMAHQGQSSGCRDAIAHILLERQILCGVGDLVGGLYIERSPCPRTDH